MPGVKNRKSYQIPWTRKEFSASIALALMIGLLTPVSVSALPIDTGSFSGGSSSDTPAPGTPSGTWQTSQISITVAEGTVMDTQLIWLPQGTPRGELRWNLSGTLAEVAVLHEGSETETGAVSYPLTVALPPVAETQYFGTVQFVDDGGPIGPAVEVTVDTDYGGSEKIPTQLASPVPERIVVFEGAELIGDELLVTIEDENPNNVVRTAAQSTGASILGADQELGIYQLRYRNKSHEDLVSIKGSLSAIPGISSVASNYIGYSDFHFSDLRDETAPSDYTRSEWESSLNELANDPRLQPWLLETESNWPLQQINAPLAWGPLEGSERFDEPPHWGPIEYDNTKVGIIDSMPLYTDHEDLRVPAARSRRPEKMAAFMEERGSHSTHVSGIACSSANNGVGIAGVARKCDLRDYHARSDMYSSNSTVLSFLTQSMARAGKDGARVVNISMSFTPKPTEKGNCSGREPGFANSTRSEMQKILSAVVRKNPNTLWVVSAGNSCIDAKDSFPAALANDSDPTVAGRVVSVAATTKSQELASYSNYGDSVTIAAPGGENREGGRIISTMVSCGKFLWIISCESRYGPNYGTSMATPYVTGTAVLGFNANPGMRPEEMKKCLVDAPKEIVSGNDPTGGRWASSSLGHRHVILDTRATIVCAMGGWEMPS